MIWTALNYAFAAINVASLGWFVAYLWRNRTTFEEIKTYRAKSNDGYDRRFSIMLLRNNGEECYRLNVEVRSVLGAWSNERYFDGSLEFINDRLSRYHVKGRA